MAKHTERPALTGRQALVLAFVQTHTRDVGYPPTLREIGAHMGIRSTNGVNDHLVALERKGYIIRDSLKSRSIRVVVSEGPIRSTHPECEKLSKATTVTQPAGEFVEWLRSHGYEIAERTSAPGCGVYGLCSCSKSLERLLAEWQGIDLEVVEDERRQILADLGNNR
jgi:SOS-response transcriptional repressor LexA